ncbi:MULTISPECIES: LuxR C-terminal-related transcriptional regulator [Enterobacteriaceae]|uniref:Response regulator receiver protein n=1 Tax=Enterobacter sp. (strain 638) TaxID=399742 RepID=A0A9J9GIR0_ENT38|nr:MULTISPECIES: LuxR C-terminal-related transcriptional regulator [Enterobacteriaceae]ABP62060.1 response regulator receiver protein [Enterobacter sp. 638]UJD96049.1 response regulator transcription factor [Lelliottia amnigena]
MFTCQIRYVARNDIYLSGIRSGLESIVSANPGWHCQFSPLSPLVQEEEHLIIIDATGCENLTTLSPESMSVLNSKHTLVMVRAIQRWLIKKLLQQYSCSILCVDELNFQMREIIQQTMENKRYLSPLIIRQHHAASLAKPVVFTPAESTVLEYLRKGCSGSEISKLLFRSEKTISSHKRNIMGKLGVRDDFELNSKINTSVAVS